MILFLFLLLVTGVGIVMSAVLLIAVSWKTDKTFDEVGLRLALAKRDDEEHYARLVIQRREQLRMANRKWFRPMTKAGAEE